MEHPESVPLPPPELVSRPRRRWPWVVALSLALVMAASAGAVAWQQREVAALWQQRALAVEDHRDDALGRVEALQLQLDEVAELLDASETDLNELQERVRDLADEKAQAEDTATTVQVQRDQLVQLSNRIASAISALDQCVNRMGELHTTTVSAFNRVTAGEQVDVGPLNQLAQTTTNFCNDARSAAAG
ncbi:MAG: hypothetical protein WD576_02210, partial [Nitriliruptoraceae bacterium]